jgi:hypothetical protein
MGQFLNGDKVRIQRKKALHSEPVYEKTKYFEPSTKDFMINYRVENLEALIDQLRKDNVTHRRQVETADYGKFIHIMDIEGNKIELWEPMTQNLKSLAKKLCQDNQINRKTFLNKATNAIPNEKTDCSN